MGSMTPDEFDALTRVDFNVFVERVFAELNPATTYKDNFHIAIIVAKDSPIKTLDDLRGKRFSASTAGGSMTCVRRSAPSCGVIASVSCSSSASSYRS